MQERAATTAQDDAEVGRVFEAAASYLSLLSEPTRLRILHAICHEEKSVNDILALTSASQTNVSRHLALMYRSQVLNRRRDGTSVYYSIADQTLVQICRSVCNHVAAELDGRSDSREAARLFQPPQSKQARRRS